MAIDHVKVGDPDSNHLLSKGDARNRSRLPQAETHELCRAHRLVHGAVAPVSTVRYTAAILSLPRAERADRLTLRPRWRLQSRPTAVGWGLHVVYTD